MSRKIIYCVLLILVLTDIGFSFLQFSHAPLDSDMTESIVPAHYINPIFENPLGFKILKEKTTYHNPNRFFSHWSINKYFNKTPIFLQNFFEPIDSVYLSCAIIKTIVHVALIFLLAWLSSGTANFLKLDFILIKKSLGELCFYLAIDQN